ncbi:ABC transporter substrate-binding protein [Halosimplex litoreum]|uniref:ABC transporter substrate-binding protein n=1 Tax=Halosimplex litoreum TaxID=1198301 RepID=A0A7T3KVP9_9EURY|nr:ABC transporter substrate-binding protein [Halosimplex litoreum]QPV63369.1 ABC transporter substrate-binding protein [Halosimplex litoreum]
MSDNQNHGSNGTPMSRRRMMQLLGATGVATGLAGCGGQSAVETETQGDGGTGDGGDGAADTETGTPTPTATPIQEDSESLATIQELAYVTNQQLPVLPVQEKLAQSFQTTDDWSVPSKDSDKTQLYWPTEWLPRSGDWTSTGDDDRLTFAQWAVPQDSQYNPWNGKNFAEPRRLLFDRFMKYNLATQEYSGYVVSDHSLDGTTLTLKVREDQTWHNGDPVTATDVANQIKLDIYNGGSLGNFVAPDDEGAVSERVVASDESTVEVTLTEAVNEGILLAYLQPKYLVAHDGTYGEHVEALDSAGSEDARTQALSDLTDATVPEPVGCGPFQFEDADTQRTLLTKYDDHPDASNANYPEAEYLYKPQNQGRWNSLINEETDGSATLFMPSNKLRQLPDSVQVSLIPRHWGMGLVFNFEQSPVDDARVRKAIAHVVNREAVAKNSGAGTNSKIACTYPSGLTGEFNGQIEGAWLDGVVDEFDTYGRGGAQTDQAAQLLRDAGYEKSGGTWQKDGETLTIPIKGPSGFSDWVAGANTIVSQLKDFGIDARANMLDSSTYWGQDYANGDFVVGMQGWASYNQAHPYFHFQWIYDSGDATNYWNMPDEFQTPVLHDQVRSGETVAPVDLVESLTTASE